MKTGFFFSTLFLFVSSSFFSYDALAATNKKGPLLVVVLMVKNEEAVIRQTLEMYCKADPKGQKIAYFVYDTGPDAWSPTMQKAKELFDEYRLTNYIILQEPFIDFATSRNKGLRLAEAYFPESIFMLMPDAEWYLTNVQGLLEFCEKHQANQVITEYLIRILSPGLDFYTPRLIRAHKGVCFEGVVHEIIKGSGTGTMMGPENVHFNYPEIPQGLQSSQNRWKRDYELLLREYQKNPRDARNAFYLAQTCDCVGDLETAYHYYIKRTELSGFVEEDYMAHYRLGLLTERMIDERGAMDWPRALRHYLDAFLMRPCRAEPLVRIAVHYINQNIYDLAFLYSYIACQMPYPSDVLFVEKELYDRVRFETFAKAALKVDLEIPERICKQAFARNEQQVPLEKFLLAQALGV